ncbi:MAG: hypothetical protein J6U17_03440 [Kiritimatiellae bacterium]|nr:hypothetical protein [Kiritimatiellia bacterium]
MALQAARVAAVIVLLCAAAAIATPPGRLPLALRGLHRIMRRDAGSAPGADASARVSPGRRLAAFLLVVLAALAAMV